MLTLLTALMVAAPMPVDSDQYGIRVTINGGDYNPGDDVKVEVEPGEDGYLVVMRVDGDGYVRVLFPLDPDLDTYVRGGRRYELRGRGARSAFQADDRGGTGLVFAALSREPLSFAGYSVGMHWNYEALRLEDPAGDIEAQLLGLTRRMADNGRFDYDLAGYRVWGPGFESEQPIVVADPYATCLACGYGGGYTGISVGVSWRDPWHYDPWHYDPWYDPWYPDPYRYRHRSGYGWNGWWGWDPYWGTPYRPITVINVPPRPTVPNTPYGTRARPRAPITAIPTTVVGGNVVRPGTDPGLAGGYQGRSRSPVAPQMPVPGAGNVNRPSQTPTAPAGGNAAGTRSRAPQTARPATPPPATRTNPPAQSSEPPRQTPPPATTREAPPPASTPPTNRARPRQPTAEVVSSEQNRANVSTERQATAAERPVYRPPVATTERPVTTTPTTRAIAPQQRPTSAPPVRQSEPPRARTPQASRPAQSAPPASSSTTSRPASPPPAARPSSPPPATSSNRPSSPPPAASSNNRGSSGSASSGSTSTTSRARPRGG